MKLIKRLLIIIVGIFIAVTVFGTLYMFDFALKTKSTSHDIKASYDYLFERKYMKEWVDSLEQNHLLFDTVIHSNYDGIKLHALYIKAPQPTTKTALLIHGYTDNAVRMLMIAHLYNKELGYNVLIPDLSAHGESEGKWIGMGWLNRYEVIQWLDVALDIFGRDNQVVIHGISMGAATTMMTSGEKLPDNVKCFVADCGYTSVWDQFAHQLKRDFDLPIFPLMYATSIYSDYKLGWNFKEASSLEQVKKCNRPMFFIHGDADAYVPISMVYPLYDAKQGDKELWVVPGVKHADAYWDKTEEYVTRVKNFTEKYIH